MNFLSFLSKATWGVALLFITVLGWTVINLFTPHPLGPDDFVWTERPVIILPGHLPRRYDHHHHRHRHHLYYPW